MATITQKEMKATRSDLFAFIMAGNLGGPETYLRNSGWTQITVNFHKTAWMPAAIRMNTGYATKAYYTESAALKLQVEWEVSQAGNTGLIGRD